MTRQEYNRKILGLEKRIRFLESSIKVLDTGRLQSEVIINDLKKTINDLRSVALQNDKQVRSLVDRLPNEEVTIDEKDTEGNSPLDAFSDLDNGVRNIPTKGKISPSGNTKKTKASLLKRARKSLLGDR